MLKQTIKAHIDNLDPRALNVRFKLCCDQLGCDHVESLYCLKCINDAVYFDTDPNVYTLDSINQFFVCADIVDPHKKDIIIKALNKEGKVIINDYVLILTD